MPRLLLTLPALLGLTVTPILGAPEVAPAASESAIEIRYTVADHVSRLDAEAEKLRRELARLESGESEFATDNDLLKLETSAVRKELAHRESALAVPQESHAHACEFLQDAIDALRPLATLPPVATSLRALARGDVPAADAALDLVCQAEATPRLVAAEAFFQRGSIAEQTGDYRLALRHYERAATLDPTERRHLERAGAMAASMGFYAKAVQWAEEALLLPPETDATRAPNAARLLNNLGSARGALADFDSARAHFQLALDQAIADGEADSGEAARSRFSLACLDFATGNIREAAAQFEGVLPAYREVFGPQDVRTADVLRHLAICHAELGDYAQAVARLEQAISIDLQIGEPARAQLAQARRQLGALHVIRADYRQAQACYETALEDDRLLLGDDHPCVSRDLQELAYVYQQLGDVRKALALHQRALEIKVRNFGPQHPEVASEWSDIGSCWSALGDTHAALAFHQKALESNLRSFGPEHPEVARGWNDTAACWRALGEPAKALALLERALAVELRVRGPDHPYVAVRLNNIGSCWHDLGELTQAVSYYERALAIDEKALGANHPTIARRLNNLGTCWADLGDMTKAIGYLQRALAIDLERLGPNHPNIATYHANLASCWFDLGDYRKALESYQAALRVRARAEGPDDPQAARIRERIGACIRMLEQQESSSGTGT